MAKLYLEVKNQTLTVRSDIERIVENSINYLEYEVNFKTDDWEKYITKEIIITYDGEIHKRNLLEGKTIPYEVIHAPGFTIHLVGTNIVGEKITDRITTNVVPVQVFPGGKLEGEIPDSELPDADFLTQFKDLQNKVNINTTDIEGLDTRVRDLEENFADIEKLTSLESKISSIEAEISDLDDIRNDVKDNIHDIEEINTTLLSLDNSIKDLEITAKIKNNILVIDYNKNLEEKEG